MRLFSLIAALFLTVSVAHADYLPRVGSLSMYHGTVGTTAADAIPAASVSGVLVSFKVCNDAVNTSTFLIVGKAADPATDGKTLLPGACFVCENCKPSILKGLKVKGQAAANGYSVIQYKQ